MVDCVQNHQWFKFFIRFELKENIRKRESIVIMKNFVLFAAIICVASIVPTSYGIIKSIEPMQTIDPEPEPVLCNCDCPVTIQKAVVCRCPKCPEIICDCPKCTPLLQSEAQPVATSLARVTPKLIPISPKICNCPACPANPPDCFCACPIPRCYCPACVSLPVQ